MGISEDFVGIEKKRGLATGEDPRMLAGFIDGFPVSLAAISSEEMPQVIITIRIVDRAGVDKFFDEARKIRNFVVSDLSINRREGYIRYTYRYPSPSAPGSIGTAGTPQALGDVLAALMRLVTDSLPPPPRECEWCNKKAGDTLTLDGRIPRRMCPRCSRPSIFREKKKRLPSPKYLKACFYGFLVAVGGAVIHGLFRTYADGLNIYSLYVTGYFLLYGIIGVGIALVVHRISRPLGIPFSIILICAAVFIVLGDVLTYSSFFRKFQDAHNFLEFYKFLHMLFRAYSWDPTAIIIPAIIILTCAFVCWIFINRISPR
jgi:hypothetical protein